MQVPIICGWIAVGTQYRAGSVNEALQDDNNRAWRVLADLDAHGKPISVFDRQRGILSRSGTAPASFRASVEHLTLTVEPLTSQA